MTRVLLAAVLLALCAVGALIARPTVQVNMFVDEDISMEPYGSVFIEQWVNGDCVIQMWNRWNDACNLRVTAAL
jgi:hypothetical protein